MLEFWIPWTVAVVAFVITMALRFREAKQVNRARAAQQRLVSQLQTLTGKTIDQSDLLDTRPLLGAWTWQEIMLGASTVIAFVALLLGMLQLAPAG